MISTSVMAEDQSDQTVAISAGRKASFEGFLVPMWQFRKMNQDLIEFDILKKQTAPPVVEETHPIKVFAIGFIAGSFAVLLFDKLGSK